MIPAFLLIVLAANSPVPAFILPMADETACKENATAMMALTDHASVFCYDMLRQALTQGFTPQRAPQGEEVR